MSKIKITCKTESLMSIDALENFQGNLKRIDEASLKKLKNSILKHGFAFPIFVWESNILDGHQRIAAIKKLIDDGHEITGGKLPVVQIQAKSKKDAAEKLLLINSRYAKIDQAGFEWFAGEFDLDLDDLAGILEMPEIEFLNEETFKGNTDPDEIPEVVDIAVTRPGDIWVLGNHRLMCGDSTIKEHIDLLMKCENADLCLTDPPYGVAYVGKTKDRLTIESDDVDEESLKEFVKLWFDNVDYATRAGSYWIATVPPGPLQSIFLTDWKNRGILRQVLVWVKDSMVLGHSEYHYKHEPILFGWKKGDRLKNTDRSKTTVWEFNRPKISKEHPTMKPILMWAYAIQNHTVKNDLLYEPFSGSGTSIIASEQTGRRCYAMEISPKYVDVAIKRWQDYTGNDAVLEVTGKTFNDHRTVADR